MIQFFKRKPPKKVVKSIQDNCTRCGICIAKCRHKALVFPVHETTPIVIDQDRCVGCGKCVRNCPWGALVLVDRKINE